MTKNMKLSLFDDSKSHSVIELFRNVFAASEGEEEGEVIAGFVTNLIATTKPRDLIGCMAEEGDTILGCIFFSRFVVPNDQLAFIMSPVAVAADAQGTGIGQKLIQYGLDYLKLNNVELAFTYGDPNYYSKIGFKQISENSVKAPFSLSQPMGWLAQSLDGGEVPAMVGATQCVEALNDPALW